MSKPQHLSSLKDKTVTLPLLTVLELALGHEYTGTRTIPDNDSAEILSTIFKGTQLFYIQLVDFDGSKLEHPVLWSYKEWYDSSTNYKRLKKWQDQCIDNRNIQLANVKILKKAIRDIMLIDDDDIATGRAYYYLTNKKFGTIKNVLKVKLITKVEDIQ